MPSLIEKVASRYSTYWATSNTKARATVIAIPGMASRLSSKLWCAHVNEEPLLNNTTVLKKGIPQGLMATIPTGGH
jgi:hypothetical protein